MPRGSERRRPRMPPTRSPGLVLLAAALQVLLLAAWGAHAFVVVRPSAPLAGGATVRSSLPSQAPQQEQQHGSSSSSSRIGTTRLYAATITRSRPRRRDLKIEDTIPEAPAEGDDEEPGFGGGGGKRWVRIYPVGLGKVGKDQPAVFLARRREVGEESRLETLPLPLFNQGDYEMLQAAFQSQARGAPMARASLAWSGRHMTVGRDNGAFDNLPWAWVEREDGTTAAEAKRAAFDAFLGKGLLPSFQAGSPYGILAAIIEDMLGAAVLDLLIDEEDSSRGPGITFGPIVLLQEAIPEDRFQPSSGGLRGQIVDCLLDEVVGLSLELGRGIGMPEDLYEGTCVPTQTLRREGGVLQLQAEKDVDNEGRIRDLMQKMEAVKPAWEIKSAAEFRAMDTQSKRLSLIKSGAEDIPKRRQGPQELDIAMLEYLDETVRREARIAVAVEAGDWAAVEKLNQGKSKRGIIKDRLQAARAAGDEKLVAELEEELAWLTLAKQDPTQDEGAYQSYLDADDWYLKNRRI